MVKQATTFSKADIATYFSPFLHFLTNVPSSSKSQNSDNFPSLVVLISIISFTTQLLYRDPSPHYFLDSSYRLITFFSSLFLYISIYLTEKIIICLYNCSITCKDIHYFFLVIAPKYPCFMTTNISVISAYN